MDKKAKLIFNNFFIIFNFFVAKPKLKGFAFLEFIHEAEKV